VRAEGGGRNQRGDRGTRLNCRQPSQDREHVMDGVEDRRAGYVWSADGAEGAINVGGLECLRR